MRVKLNRPWFLLQYSSHYLTPLLILETWALLHPPDTHSSTLASAEAIPTDTTRSPGDAMGDTDLDIKPGRRTCQKLNYLSLAGSAGTGAGVI